MVAGIYPPARSYWIIARQFLAGAYPADFEAASGRKRLQEFLRAGIDAFISLMLPGERGMHGIPDSDYEPPLRELAAAGESNVTFKRFPIRDGHTCSISELSRILDQIDTFLRAGRRIYLHCFAGHGRTGMIAGCWLVRHGMTGEDALRRIAELRSHDEELSNWSSPQTWQQCEMVRKWHFLERSSS